MSHIAGDLREYRGALVLPLRDVNGKLHSLQFIGRWFEKISYWGARCRLFLYADGTREEGPLVSAKGTPPGRVSTRRPDIPLFAPSTVGTCWRRRSDAGTVAATGNYCCRNDEFTDGNPGLRKANAAAKAIRAKLAVPQFEKRHREQTD